MPFLPDRVRAMLADVPNVTEKQMFGGLAFMVNDKLCVCAYENEILCRLDPALQEEAAEQHGCRLMHSNGRTYKGYIYVNEQILRQENQLQYWVNLCLEFNQYAQKSKR
ncbi:Transcriptional regulator of competence genes, TfoX/Sxy family [Flexibacter flexilis DSM 6793]|uniref:Transcriptional regulator of competence genes, TfoX/Sxy family n=1 Tax=Flexibacter flexilis DSM 6793 TaxID=927664 RepID=A0A1I1MXF6_9BACT|nr:TfoX/Sxy family protein [Flexibacter flexilis]SFC87243.1 Transcriptional regulator of competence genes, TfoX/Sxy family [Flexibacter flexilis DSM 6793]